MGNTGHRWCSDPLDVAVEARHGVVVDTCGTTLNGDLDVGHRSSMVHVLDGQRHDYGGGASGDVEDTVGAIHGDLIGYEVTEGADAKGSKAALDTRGLPSFSTIYCQTGGISTMQVVTGAGQGVSSQSGLHLMYVDRAPLQVRDWYIQYTLVVLQVTANGRTSDIRTPEPGNGHDKEDAKHSYKSRTTDTHHDLDGTRSRSI